MIEEDEGFVEPTERSTLIRNSYMEIFDEMHNIYLTKRKQITDIHKFRLEEELTGEWGLLEEIAKMLLYNMNQKCLIFKRVFNDPDSEYNERINALRGHIKIGLLDSVESCMKLSSDEEEYDND